MMEIRIRPETAANEATVAAVVDAAFRDAPLAGRTEHLVVRAPRLTLPGVPPPCFQAMAFGSSLPRGSVSYPEAFRAMR